MNGREFRVRVTDRSTFEIEENTRGFGAYVRGGYVKQIKQSVTHQFRPLQAALADPGEYVLADFAKMERPPVLHLAFQALHEFVAQKGVLPVSGSPVDAEELWQLALALNEAGAVGPKIEAEPLGKEADLIRKFALGARGVINPMTSLFGGIVGQEVLKASSGKFTPIKQWFYFDAAEALPDGPLPPEEVSEP